MPKKPYKMSKKYFPSKESIATLKLPITQSSSNSNGIETLEGSPTLKSMLAKDNDDSDFIAEEAQELTTASVLMTQHCVHKSKHKDQAIGLKHNQDNRSNINKCKIINCKSRAEQFHSCKYSSKDDIDNNCKLKGTQSSKQHKPKTSIKRKNTRVLIASSHILSNDTHSSCKKLLVSDASTIFADLQLHEEDDFILSIIKGELDISSSMKDICSRIKKAMSSETPLPRNMTRACKQLSSIEHQSFVFTNQKDTTLHYSNMSFDVSFKEGKDSIMEFHDLNVAIFNKHAMEVVIRRCYDDSYLRYHLLHPDNMAKINPVLLWSLAHYYAGDDVITSMEKLCPDLNFNFATQRKQVLTRNEKEKLQQIISRIPF